MSSKVENFADVPGGYLYYQTSGQGQDVVLFNGGTADLRMWDTTTAWLTQIARVTTFDYRDTGLSSPGTAPYSEIDDITAVLDHAGIESAVLVGCSEGGRRALAFACQHPGRTRRVVVVARRLANQAPSATLTVIPDADHFPMLSTPQEFERILREVLQSAPAATSPPGSSTI